MKASIHRPTRAYVDVEAIAYNVQQIQAHIPKETLTFAVVKANAYGHGVEPVVECLLPIVDAFCVSNLDEALEVRQVAGEKPILILGVAPVEHVAIAIKEEIRYTVASLEWLKALLAEKSTCPGVSKSVTSISSHASRACLEKIVIPRFFSNSYVSRNASPLSTRPRWRIMPPA